MENKILVTRSSMPDYEEYCEEIKELWDSRWLTNMGTKHRQLQSELEKLLGVPHVTLYTNGHLALENVLAALNLPKGGEVITTPFTFASTTHAIVRNGLIPVFCDIKESDYTIDEGKIEKLVTEKTVAIVPVHVYGNVCNVEEIDRIAKKYNLKVIYDAAHAFGVKYKGKGIGNFGDASIFSFHATKVYNTIEGGALICHSKEMKQQIDDLKNFGFHDEVTVVAPGINSKMDEMRSAYGLLNLKQVDSAIEARHQVAIKYRDALKNVDGITYFEDMEGVRHNYSYFPIFIDAEKYGMTRDELYFKMKDAKVLGRRYFYPLISEFSTYRGCPGAEPSNLSNAHRMANSVICLPMHHMLSDDDINRTLELIVK